MNVFDYIMLGFAGLIALFLLCSFLFLIFGWFKFFFHDVLLWHKPAKNSKQSFDGCSIHSICKYCGKEIMQDSQGNWFEVSDYAKAKKEVEEPVFYGKWRLETNEEEPNPMFKLVVCTYCNEKANHTYKFCPHCGKIMSNDNTQKEQPE